METKMTFFRKILKNKKGATAIEYGLIAALISVAAISAISALGTNLKETFSTASGKIADGNDASAD
jgi:pilus assembly protein Flp/PilA